MAKNAFIAEATLKVNVIKSFLFDFKSKKNHFAASSLHYQGNNHILSQLDHKF